MAVCASCERLPAVAHPAADPTRVPVAAAHRCAVRPASRRAGRRRARPRRRRCRARRTSPGSSRRPAPSRRRGWSGWSPRRARPSIAGRAGRPCSRRRCRTRCRTPRRAPGPGCSRRRAPGPTSSGSRRRRTAITAPIANEPIWSTKTPTITAPKWRSSPRFMAGSSARADRPARRVPNGCRPRFQVSGRVREMAHGGAACASAQPSSRRCPTKAPSGRGRRPVSDREPSTGAGFIRAYVLPALLLFAIPVAGYLFAGYADGAWDRQFLEVAEQSSKPSPVGGRCRGARLLPGDTPVAALRRRARRTPGNGPAVLRGNVRRLQAVRLDPHGVGGVPRPRRASRSPSCSPAPAWPSPRASCSTSASSPAGTSCASPAPPRCWRRASSR